MSGRYFHTPPQFSAEDIRAARIGADMAAEFTRCAVFEELLTPERGMVQLALRTLLDEPTTTTIIPGGKSLEDYRAAVRASELPPLTAAERGRLAELRALATTAG